MTALILTLSLMLDWLFGEPQRRHPLVGFGNITHWVERSFYRPTKLAGAIGAFVLVVPITLLSGWLASFSPLLIGVITVYVVIGHKSLSEHALAVKHALQSGDLSHARQRISYMVSRETKQLDETAISRATLESVLENGSDAIFAPLFWFAIAGVPGAVLYRLSNTLDAMWGYKNDRYLQFGWAAAKFDDILNYIPARLTAISYAAVGNWPTAIQCWREQAPACESPNAGPVMAAGAGSLQLKLGGAATYHGSTLERPILGCGRDPQHEDISSALNLIKRSLLLWLVVILLLQWLTG